MHLKAIVREIQKAIGPPCIVGHKQMIGLIAIIVNVMSMEVSPLCLLSCASNCEFWDAIGVL